MEAFGGKAGAVNHLNARQAALRDLGARAYCDIMLHASGLLSPGSFTPGIRLPRLRPVRDLAAFPEAQAHKQLGSGSSSDAPWKAPEFAQLGRPTGWQGSFGWKPLEGNLER